MPLTPSERSVFNRASNAGIKTCASRLLPHVAQNRWLDPGNRYRVGILAALKADQKRKAIDSVHLGEYVAASAPLHCCDGWAFLGRALSSHLRGDAATSKHLAYYAELRAAMALLATQGIGIFNNAHYVIDKNGSAHLAVKDKGTHLVAWEMLEAWASVPAAADLLGELFVAAGQPIRVWIDAIPKGVTWKALAKDWLLKMGLDLKVLTTDRAARNEVSYRPTQLVGSTRLSSKDATAILRELWTLLEPVPSQPFLSVDRHLLRITVEEAFRSTQGSTPLQAPVLFPKTISDIVRAMSLGAETDIWEKFLLRKVSPDDPKIIHLARHEIDETTPEHHAAVMGRALLLLRVASGAVKTTFVESGIKLEALEFWWQTYGLDRGLWKVAPETNDLLDQWADTEVLLQDVDDWLAGGSTATYSDLVTGLPQCHAGLTGLEIVGIWSLAS